MIESPDDEQLIPAPDETPDAPLRAEDILLRRLQEQQVVKPQLPQSAVAGIVIIVIALGVIIYFLSRTPDKYADNPHSGQNPNVAADSSEVFQRRLQMQPLADSLEALVKQQPDNLPLRLEYANVLYEGNFWDDAKDQYERYLAAKPNDVDARIDYGYVIAQATHNFRLAVAEIDSGLAIDPNHVKGLFNAGLLAVQAYPDKATALQKSEEYFMRAQAASRKSGDTSMSANIEQILAEIKKLRQNKQ